MTDYKIVFTISLILGVLFDLLVTATRSSLFNSSVVRLLARRDENEIQVNRAVVMLRFPQRARASLGLIRLLVRFLLAGIILGLTSMQAWDGPQILIAGGILTLAALALFWMEWVVEGLVARKPEVWVQRLSAFAKALLVISTPFVAIPLYLNPSRGADEELSNTVTEAELKSMVDASHEDGVLEQDERKMIYSIFQLGDTLAREIMVPRIYLTALDAGLPLSEATAELARSKFSRVPVYEETIDHILGIIYAKDLLHAHQEGSQINSLRELLRPAYFIPEAKKVDELLAEMQSQRVHMAIVVDEYGGVAGVVTLEDIVEEIVGEIQDEYDLSEELPYQEIGDGEYIFLGRIGIEDFNEIMRSQLSHEEAETLGGYIYSQVGRVPVGGESVRVDDLLLTMEQVAGRRIRKVRAKKINPTQEGSHEETTSNR